MKKVLLLILIASASILSSAQGIHNNNTCDHEKQHTIVYDFTTQTVCNPAIVPYQDFIALKIININTLIYDVKIEAKQIDRSPDIPSWFDPKDVITKKLDKTKKDIQGVLDTLATFIDTLYNKKMGDLQKKDIPPILEKFQTQEQELSNLAFELESIRLLKNKLVLIANSSGSYNSIKSAIEVLEESYTYLASPIELINKYNRTYMLFEITTEKIKASDLGKHNELKSYLEKVETLTKAMNDTIQGENYMTEIFESSHLAYQLKNEENFIVKSYPVQALKDYIEFSVTVTKKDNSEKTETEAPVNFTVRVPVKGGVRFDFSTGFIVKHDQYDRSYSLSTSSNDPSQSIISEDSHNGAGQVAIGGLLHMVKRTGKNISPALSFGMEADLSDLTQASLMLGGSAIIGTDQRFVITAGVSLSSVDYLKGKYQLGKEYETAGLSDELTEKIHRPGIFIGLTYNLTNKTKE